MPEQHGYQRVETGDLSTSTTSTSLDTVVLDSGHDILTPVAEPNNLRSFSPIYEADVQDTKSKSKSKLSVKGSKVSFQEDDQFDTDDENFSEQRDQFQQKKATSSDHKSIFKVSFFL